MTLPKKNQHIAVIGMGCKVDTCESPAAFWKLLLSGNNPIRAFPDSRWHSSFNRYYKKQFFTDKIPHPQSGCFIADPESLDSEFFDINQKEANAIDPQQRLILQTSWHALEDANLRPSSLRGTKTAVYMGVSSFDHALLTDKNPDHIHSYSALGNSAALASNRLSYLFDLNGPSMTIDAACASSLVCIHEACKSLSSYESDLALAGGVNAILTPTVNASFFKAGLLSPDRRCKCFDENADGFVRSEGCGIVVLKRLEDAIRDMDRIHGIILGSSVNQDGRSPAITTPNKNAQISVIKKALNNALVTPDQVGYLEAHSTGTRVGDRVEIESIYDVFCKEASAQNSITVGSLKSNIGHTEAAAGVLSLIKTLWILKTKKIPANLHFLKPQAKLSGLFNNIAVASTNSKFNHEKPVCGISSFGFGGTNCHLVLQGFEADTKSTHRQEVSVLCITAKSKEAFTNLLIAYRDKLVNDTNIVLEDIAYTSNVKRDHFKFRFSCPAQNKEDVIRELDEAIRVSSLEDVVNKFIPRQVCITIGTNYSHYFNNFVGILQEAKAQSCIAELKNALQKSEFANQTDPLISIALNRYIYQCALWSVWKNYGIQYDSICVQNGSELTGLVIAGILSPLEGLEILLGSSHHREILQSDQTDIKNIKFFFEKIGVQCEPQAWDISLLRDRFIHSHITEISELNVPKDYLELRITCGRTANVSGRILDLIPEFVQVNKILSALFNFHQFVDWTKIESIKAGLSDSLPLYPFVSKERPYIQTVSDSDHVIQTEISAVQPVRNDQLIWNYNVTLSLEDIGFVRHHQIGGALIIPGVVYLSVIKNAISKRFSKKIDGFQKLKFLYPAFINQKNNIRLEISFECELDFWRFEIYYASLESRQLGVCGEFILEK